MKSDDSLENEKSDLAIEEEEEEEEEKSCLICVENGSKVGLESLSLFCAELRQLIFSFHFGCYSCSFQSYNVYWQ
jgi:hypothetical protein